MRLPKLYGGDRTARRSLVRFGGINYGEDRGEGELAESKGLSCARFPCLSQRGGRVQVRTCAKPNAIFAWGKLCVVDGTSLIYDGKTVGSVMDGPKEFAVVNTKLCIFPDKMYLDLTSREFLPLEAALSSKAGTISDFTANSLTLQPDELVSAQSSNYNDFLYGDGSIQKGEHGIKTYASVSWNASAKTWTLTGEAEQFVKDSPTSLVGRYVMLRRTDVAGSYVLNVKSLNKGHDDADLVVTEDYGANDDRGFYAKITHVEQTTDVPDYKMMTWSTTLFFEVRNGANVNDSFLNHFAAGDRVDITGCTAQGGNNVVKAAVKSVTASTLTFTSDVFTAGTESGVVTVKRSVPELTYICESDNRLWGCEGHTIYASALGDPKNFYVYDGLSTDSYTVAVGTDGAFTGCIAYSGAVLFWKEDCLHKVLGDLPGEYTLYTYSISGLQAGSGRSMAIVNEVLFYKGRSGVYAYSGGTPRLISAALGLRRYDGAAGGSDGRNYYLSMRDMDSGAWGLFSYDPMRGVWLREDETHALGFTCLDGTLHVMEAGGAVWRSGPSGERVEWLAEFAPFTDDTLLRKRHLRFSLRLELEAGATVRAEVREDDRPWRAVWQTGDARMRTVTVPIFPRRCDSFSLRLSGTGGCLIRALERETQVGSA